MVSVQVIESTRRTGSGRFLTGVATLLLALVIGGTATAQSASGELRADEILSLMRQGRTAEALPLCRLFNEDFPGNPTMLYNLACLENLAGNSATAVAAYGRAVAAGFSDFSYAQDDPDLQGGIREQIRAYHTAEIAALAARSENLAVTLEHGAWTDPLILHGDAAGHEAGPVELRLRWDDLGLNLELAATEPWSSLITADPLAPWNGGGGLVVTLMVPDGTSAFESSNHFMFAFGAENAAGVGGVFLSAQDRWQRVLELDPKIRVSDAGVLQLTAVIPWPTIMPFHPLVDTTLGINAALTLSREDGYRRAALLEAPDLQRPRALTRRFVPARFRTSSVAGETFLGRVEDSISRDRPLAVELTAITEQAGTGILSIDFVDGQGNSVLPTGRIAGKVDLVSGPNVITREVDFTSLDAGAYLMKATMKFPAGRTAVWSTSILQLTPGWDDEIRESISRLAPKDRPTATYYLTSIEEAVARHRIRRNPGAIATTLNDIRLLLESDIELGTILPDKGSFLLVYPGPDGRDRRCSAYLPSGWKIAAVLNPVVVLSSAAGQASGFAHRIGQNYEHGGQRPTLKADADRGFPIYLIPHLDITDPDRNAALLTEAEVALDWARAYFDTGPASAVGIDDCGATAVQLTRSRQEALQAVLVFAGRNFEPWPQAGDDFLRRQLGPEPSAVPVTWIDFVQETGLAGQAARFLEIARELGYDVAGFEQVRGGLNLTQAADRTLLWAEALR